MKAEELLLVSEILGAFIGTDNRALSSRLLSGTSSFVELKVSGDIFDKNKNFCLSENINVIESIVFERLTFPSTPILEFIPEALQRCSRLNNIPASQLDILKEIKSLLRNYLILAITTPELFDQVDFVLRWSLITSDVSKRPEVQMSIKVLYLATCSIDDNFIDDILQSVDDAKSIVKTSLRLIQLKLNSLIVFESDSLALIELFSNLIKSSHFKNFIVDFDLIASCKTGKQFEQSSLLCTFISLAPLPWSAMDPRITKFESLATSRLTSSKTQGAYNKSIENLSEAYGRYRQEVVSIFKHLMKGDSVNFVIEFFTKSINLNEDKCKMGFLFNEQLRKAVSSPGFGLGVFDLLLELVKPICSRSEIWSKVDFRSQFEITDMCFSSKYDIFGTSTEHPLTSNTSLCSSSSTKLFFILLSSFRVHFAPLVRNTQQLSKQLEHFQQQHDLMASNDFKKSQYKQMIERLKTEFMLHRLIFEDQSRCSVINSIYERYIDHLVNEMDSNKESYMFPAFHLLDYSEIQSFYCHLRPSPMTSFGSTSFTLLIKLLEKSLLPKYKSKQPVVQAKLFDILFTLHVTEKKGIVFELKKEMNDVDRMAVLLSAFIEFYSAVEHFGGEAGSADSKHRYRNYITKFLNESLQDEFYSNAFVKALESKNDTNKDFIGHLFADLNFFLEEVFLLLEKLSKLEGRTNQQSGLVDDFSQLSINNNQESERETEGNLSETARSWFSFGKETLEFIGILSSLSTKIFNNVEWAEKVARALNYYATRLSSSSYRSLSKAAIQANIQPLDFIKQLVLVYIRVGVEEIVQQAIINDDRCYSTKVLVDLGQTCQRKSLISSENLIKFEKLILQLDELRNEKLYLDEVMGDIPDEFTCPLTSELMTEPVRLPTSSLIVNKKAINQHFALNGFNDPFTKTELRPENLIPEDSLREKIQEFIKIKKSEVQKKYPKLNKKENNLFEETSKTNETSRD